HASVRRCPPHPAPPSFPPRRSSDLVVENQCHPALGLGRLGNGDRKRGEHAETTKEPTHRHEGVRVRCPAGRATPVRSSDDRCWRSEEHTSELQSRENLVCRLLLEKK